MVRSKIVTYYSSASPIGADKKNKKKGRKKTSIIHTLLWETRSVYLYGCHANGLEGPGDNSWLQVIQKKKKKKIAKTDIAKKETEKKAIDGDCVENWHRRAGA